MNNFFKYLLFTILSLSCKKKPNEDFTISKESIVQNAPIIDKKKYRTCDEVFFDIVKSSNATVVKNFDNIHTRINNIEDDKVTIEIYVSNNISEDPSVKKIVDQTVGWLDFYPATKKMQDITNDTENPEILKYDETILENPDIANLCELFKRNTSKNNSDKIKCYRKENTDYSYTEICEYSNVTNFNSLYTDYLKTNNSDLLPNLPKKDTLYKTSSTPEIKYSIKKNIVEVNIISEGGETTLKIYNSKGKGIVEVIKSPD